MKSIVNLIFNETGEAMMSIFVVSSSVPQKDMLKWMSTVKFVAENW